MNNNNYKRTEQDIPEKLHIMLMEDDKMVSRITKEMLIRLGHEVILAEDGKEAVRLFSKLRHSIDIIIMDLSIPRGMGGIEAVKKIHEIEPDARVVVSSGYSDDESMVNFEAFGFCASITKPYRLQDLESVLFDKVDQ